MRKVLATLAVLVLVGSGIVFAQDQDPGSTKDDAVAAEFGSPISLTLDPAGDVDALKLTVPRSGVISWSVAGWDRQAAGRDEPTLSLVDAADSTITIADGEARVIAGDVFAFVSSHANPDQRRAVPRPFTITFAFTPDDKGEPDDSREAARAIEFDKPVELTLDPLGETDWLVLDVQSHGIVRWTVADWDEEATGTPAPYLWFHPAQGGTRQNERDVRALPGKLYVQVAAHENHRHRRLVVTPFQLTFTLHPEPDASEPNDTRETARPVPFGEPVHMSLDPRAEEDWLVLDVRSTGVVRWTVDGWDAEATGAPAPYLWFFPAQGGHREGERDVRATAGKLYVKVTTNENYWRRRVMAVEKPFRITFTFHADADTSEPNDTRESARPVAFEEPVELTLDPRGEVDWLALEVPSTGVVRWTVDGWDAEATGTERPYLWCYPAHGGSRQGESDVRVTAGTLFVQVAANENYWRRRVVSVDAPFRLAFTFHADADTSEPNDTRETARPVAFKEPVELTLDPRGEVDWLALEVPSTGVVRWTVDGWDAEATGTERPYLWFYPAQGGSRQGESDVRVTAGTLFVQVATHENYWHRRVVSVDAPARLSFTFHPAADASEPNDSKETARVVTFGEPVELTLDPRGEEDWMTLDIPAVGVVRWTVDGWDEDTAGSSRPYIWFHPEIGGVRQGERDVRVTEGRILVCVASDENYWKRRVVDSPFRITFTFHADPDPSEPNDARETARQSTFGEPVELTLDPRAESDWLVFDVPTVGVVRWSVDGWDEEKAGTPAPYVWFYPAQGGLRQGERDTQVIAGPLVVCIASHENYWRRRVVDTPFRITFTFIADADPSEPNGTREEARAATFGEALEMTFDPRGDEDWLVFDVPTVGVVRWTADGWDAEATGTAGPHVWFHPAQGGVRHGEGDVQVVAGKLHVMVATHENWWSRRVVGTPCRLTFTFHAEADQSEPNNTRETARVGAFDEPLEMTFDPRGDEDWLAFDVPSTGIVRWTVDGWDADRAGTPAPHVRFYPAQGGVRQGERDVRVTEGKLFASVSSNENHWRRRIVDQPVRLTFTFTGEADASEPNDTQESARPIESGSPVEMTLDPRGEVDWLVLDVASPGIVRWRVEDWDAETAGAPQPYIQFRPEGGQAVAGVNEVRVEPGRLFLVVAVQEASWRRRVIGRPFRLIVTHEPEGDAGEPNDTRETARGVAINEPVELTLDPTGDVDWMAVDVPVKGLVEARFSGLPDGLEGNRLPQAYFFPEGAVSGRTGTVRVPAGKLFAMIRTHPTVRIATPFQVTFVLTAEADPGEPDDSRDTARAGMFGEPIEMVLYPAGDEDWVRLEVPTAGILEWTLEGWETRDHEAPRITVHFGAGEFRAPRRPWARSVRVPAGVVHVHVESPTRNGVVTTPFRLTFALRPDLDPAEPDDTLDRARTAGIGEWIDCRIDPVFDEDWIVIDVPHAGIVRWDADGWLVRSGEDDNDRERSSTSSEPWVYMTQPGGARRAGERDIRVTPGPLHIVVSAGEQVGRDVESIAPFRIRFTLHTDHDASEPNDTLATARPVTVNEDIRLALDPREDTDWLVLETPGLGVVRWTVEGWDAARTGLDGPYIAPRTSAGWWETGDRELRVTGEPVHFEVRAVGPRDAVRVRAPVARTFTIRFEFVPEPDASEPNDQQETARMVRLNEPVEMWLYPRGDHDWLQVEITETGILHWWDEGWDESTTGVHEPTLRFAGDAIESGSHRRFRVQPGRLLVHVSSPEPTGTPFRLYFLFQRETDPQEPNGDFDSANPIRLDEPFPVQLSPPGDTDFLRLEVAEPGILSWNVRNWQFGGSPRITVYGSDRKPVPFTRENARVLSGTVWIRVDSPTGHIPENDRWPMFRFRLQPDRDPHEGGDALRRVTVGEPFQLWIAPSDDVDEVELEITRAERLSMTHVDGPDIDLAADVLDDRGYHIGRIRPGTVLFLSRAGVYRLRWSASRHPGGVVAPVTLSLSHPPPRTRRNRFRLQRVPAGSGEGEGD